MNKDLYGDPLASKWRVNRKCLKVNEVPVSWRDMGGSKVRPFRTALVMFATLIGIKMAHSKNAERNRSVISEMNELLQNFRS